jgi:hypothetical protein
MLSVNAVLPVSAGGQATNALIRTVALIYLIRCVKQDYDSIAISGAGVFAGL